MSLNRQKISEYVLPAVDGTHSHSNKAQLDLLSDGDHDVRTDNPHSVTKAQVGLTNVQDIKNNFIAEANPTVNDDTTQGYSAGSLWINKIAEPRTAYICIDASEGAADWDQIN